MFKVAGALIVLGGMLALIAYQWGPFSVVFIGVGVVFILAADRLAGAISGLLGFREKTKPLIGPIQWGKKNVETPVNPSDPAPAQKAGQAVEKGRVAPDKTSVWERKGPGWLKHLPKAASKKFRIPGFRQVKRWAAIGCLIINFIIGETALTAPGSQIMAPLFLLTSFLLADYVWKTRKKPGETAE